MGDPGWLLIVEQGQLWTAAVRARLRRSGVPSPPRVRRLGSAPRAAGLDLRTPLFVAVELEPSAVFESLELLSTLSRLPNTGCAALISTRGVMSSAARADLELAALEAGACLAVDSPRRLGPLLAAAARSLDAARRASEKRLSPHERVWRRLPWQLEPWPVG